MNTKAVWILKRIKGKDLGVKMFKEHTENGKKITEEIGDYKGVGMPGAYDEIVPIVNTDGKWAFGGTDKELQKFVDTFKLRDKYNEVITTARRDDYADPFFTHRYFREKPIIMFTTHVFKNDDLKEEFLLKCWQGADKVKVYGDERKVSKIEERQKKYLLILSTSIENEEENYVDKDLEASAVLFNATDEILKLMGVVLNLSFDINMRIPVLKSKLKIMAESSERMNAFSTNFFGGITEQEAVIKYGKMSIGELNIRKRIVTAINKKILVYTRRGYKLYEALLDDVFGLEQLVDYFNENEDMNEKIAKL